MASPLACKILVSGDVDGHFSALFTRVGKAHASKAGPFHALLCVGSFFGRKGHAELADFLSGAKQVPVPTYFILGDEFDTTLVDSLPAGGTLCKNLHYLGRSGVQVLRLGDNGAQQLSLAYLSGLYDPSSYFSGAMQGPQRAVKYQPNYIEEDVIRLMGAGLQIETVDVMLTAEWAKGWQMLLPAEKLPKGAGAAAGAALTNAGSPVVAKLASQISARYHFAGVQDTYFELPPYKSKHYVTRFFGLGKCQSASKEKNMYACSVNPYAGIDLTALPADMTPCPYTVGLTKPPSAASRAGMAAAAGGMGDVAGAGAAGPMSHAHDFPTEQGGKRQRLDHAQVAPDQRFSAGFMQSMNQYDAQSMNAQGAMRWDFKKPMRGPPPHSYICKGCNEPGHWAEDCPRRTRDDGPPPRDYVCKKCGQPGHYIRACPLFTAEDDARPPPPGYQCKKCMGFDHYLRNCPLILQENQARLAASNSSGVPMSRIPPPSYVCAKCQKPGHWIQHCEIPKEPPPGYVCKVCQIPGHWLKDCAIVIRENAEKSGVERKPPADYVCAHCGVKEEHFFNRCPKRLKDADLPAGTNIECWFCLATEHVRTHLILSVGVENYLALPKGALCEDHVLILPIVHVNSSLDLTPDQSAEVERYKLALRRYYRSRGMECVLYERYIPTKAAQHMHIQVHPMTRAQALAARAVLMAESKKLNDKLVWREIPAEQSLADANPGAQMFLLFELPDLAAEEAAANVAVAAPASAASSAASAAASSSSSSSSSSTSFPIVRLLHYVNPQVKIFGLFDFPRAVVAHMLGCPDKGDWRRCEVTEEAETEEVERIKPLFAPFDFTLEQADGEDDDAMAITAAGVTKAKAKADPEMMKVEKQG